MSEPCDWIYVLLLKGRPDLYLAFGGLPSMQRTAMQSDQSAERRNTKTKEGSMLKMRERGDVLWGKMYFNGA